MERMIYPVQFTPDSVAPAIERALAILGRRVVVEIRKAA